MSTKTENSQPEKTFEIWKDFDAQIIKIKY